MKSEYLIGGAALVALYLYMRRGSSASAAGASAPPGITRGTVAFRAGGFAPAVAAGAPTAAQQALANQANPGGSAVKTSAPSMGARDVAGLAGAAAAAGGCAAVPGGAALSPLCGMAGNYLGGKAYDYGKDAVNYIGGLF